MSSIESDDGWLALADADPDGAIPVIADANTAQWALKLAIGDTIDVPDEQAGLSRQAPRRDDREHNPAGQPDAESAPL